MSGGLGDAAGAPVSVIEIIVAVGLRSAARSVTLSIEEDAENFVSTLYIEQYRSLVRLALLLVDDAQAAEGVVQDSFVAMHTGSRRLRDREKALAYLRKSVVNESRSVRRRRAAAAQRQSPSRPVDRGAAAPPDRFMVIAVLRELPPTQREAIVLRYYADLSEAQIAAAMGISRGAVKSHTARGMSALRAAIESEADVARVRRDTGETIPSARAATETTVSQVFGPEPIQGKARLQPVRSTFHRSFPGWIEQAIRDFRALKILGWKYWLGGSAAEHASRILRASPEDLTRESYRELQNEISYFYGDLGPPPRFQAVDDND